MSTHLTSSVVFVLAILIPAPAAAEVTSEQRVACRTETQKMAQIIIRTRGKGGNYAVVDKAKAKIGEETWNAMLLAYQDNSRVSERDLATFGYEVCVGNPPAATK